MNSIDPQKGHSFKVAWSGFLQNHPLLREWNRKAVVFAAAVTSLLLASGLVLLIAALVLRGSPVEPLQAEGLGEIIPTQKYLNVASFTGKQALAKTRPFYFTTLHTMKVNNRLDSLRSSLFLKKSNYEKIKDFAMSQELTLTANDYTRMSKFSLYRSSENLMYLAYRYTDKPAEFPSKVIVVFPYDLYKTGKAFEPNDQIVAINNSLVSKWEDYAASMKRLRIKENDTAVFTVKRGEKTLDIPVLFTETNKKGAYILGVYAAEVKDYGSSPEPTDLVTFTSNFSGGSAGLMMTLELIQQLSGRDLTKGYTIAGTGTIDANGEVGEIGGMPLKIITAHKQHVDIYFVPKARHPEDFNQKEAKTAAAALGTTMKIVPVANVGEALDYLAGLTVKNAIKRR